MSQETYDIVRGIAQAAANAYDGACDDKGEPIEIGLKREKGHPVKDSRQMDGFKVRTEGTHVVLTYQADIKLKDCCDILPNNKAARIAPSFVL